uniref:Protein argonaute 2 n=1 Tax=Anthurium amnicola TaxID=1678845 RepID=A0A1D1YRV3_9ARAE
MDQQCIDSLASDLGRMRISRSPLQFRVNNNFPLQFEEKMIIYHYNIDVKQGRLPRGCYAIEQLYVRTVAYDGKGNLLSSALLPEGDFPVAVRGKTFHVTLRLLKSVPLKELMETPYQRGILRRLDVSTREISHRLRFSTRQSFHRHHHRSRLHTNVQDAMYRT